MQIEEVILVWNADAGFLGHLGYTFQKLRGHDECPLCDLTHGSLTEKPEWKACKRDLGVPIEAVYRNRLSREQTRVVDGDFPCVIARTPATLVKLMGREAIDSCAGDLGLFVERLRAAIASD